MKYSSESHGRVLQLNVNTGVISIDIQLQLQQPPVQWPQLHLFGDQVPNQIFPIKTLASVAPRHDDWAIPKLFPREVLFQAVNSVDQWLKSMLIRKS